MRFTIILALPVLIMASKNETPSTFSQITTFFKGFQQSLDSIAALLNDLSTIETDKITLMEKFEVYSKDYDQNYSTEEDKERAYENFKASEEFIRRHNKDASQSYKVAHNKFSILSHDQYTRLFRLGEYSSYSRPNPAPATGPKLSLSEDKLPKSVDWVSKNKVTAVKDQGACGSCWAFSATGAIESAYAIANNLRKPLDFSEQQLVDCDDKDFGCSGGLMDYAFEWEEKEGGLCLLSDYPYESGTSSKAGTCRESDCKDVEGSGLFAFEDVPPSDPKEMMKALSQQPVSIAIQADQPGFRFYSSGVFDGRCGTNLDHGVLAVGYGSEASPHEIALIDESFLRRPHPFHPTKNDDFWLVKNSWGESWGTNGFIKLARSKKNGPGQCGILLQASYPDIKGRGDGINVIDQITEKASKMITNGIEEIDSILGGLHETFQENFKTAQA